MKNVILLTIDTLRKDVLGCYGGDRRLTPCIDSIQERCIRFNNAQSTGPYTQAAFPGILTSSYYLEYGKPEKLSKKRVLVSEALKDKGIVTAAFHSNAYLCDFFGWNRGWNAFYDSMDAKVDDKVPYIKASVLNKKVAGWLSSQAEQIDGMEKPFFLWLHYMDVHEPYVPERKYIEIVDSSINMTDDEMLVLFKDVLLKRDVSNKNIVELLKKLYLAHVREVDDATKEFFGILEKMGLLKDSVIIIAADHGDEFGEHGGLSHDGKMYSELVNVPLIIYDPSLKKGQVCDTVVSTLDVPPTILYLFGLEPVEAFEGYSLLPLENYPVKGVYGEAIDKHGSTEKGATHEVHFYREGDLKIIYREKDDFWQMYNLKEDPKELNNIVDTSPLAEVLKKKLKPRVRRWASKENQ
jgi:arylsulfatase A-like enzyme